MAGSSLVMLAAGCFVATAVGVEAFTRWARRTRLIDIPNHRSSHDTPMPRGAGAVIVIVVTLVMTGAAAFGLLPAFVIVPALAIAAISGVDDVVSLPSWLRLLVHVACAATVGVLAFATDAGAAPTVVVAILWVVALTNIYNFMDGIDGIAGAQAVVAGGTVTAVAFDAGLSGEAQVGAAIAGASAGFLLHNWAPARVFMGDVGSAFLGFVFGTLMLEIARNAAAPAAVCALAMWPFIFDASLTLLRRTLRGENILTPHRSHLYQRLVATGWSHASVTTLYASAALAGAVAGFTVATQRGPAWLLLVVPVLAAILWAIVVWRESHVRAAPGVMRYNVAARWRRSR